MHLRVPEGYIWRLPFGQVGGVSLPIVLHVPGTRGLPRGGGLRKGSFCNSPHQVIRILYRSK